MIFLDFGSVLFKIILFYMEIEPGWLRNRLEYFLNHFGLGISLKSPCWTPKLKFSFFENPNFQFWSKTHFLNHKCQDPSCRICSYGPHGPFWFSVKIVLILKNVTKQICLGRNDLLRLLWKWIYFMEVCSEKLSYVRLLPQGLLFLTN